jgi:ATP-binding cassette subfamily F protein uup
MSFKEKQELQQLPGLIEQKELEISQIEQKLSDPEFYRTGTGAADLASRLKQLEEELMTDLQRWEDLQNRNDQQ